MKRAWIILICVFAAVTAYGQGGLRYTIQVTKFENKAGWSGRWDLGDAWGAVLTDKLQQSGKYIVIAEQDMRNAAMSEQDFAASGRTAGGKKAPKTGQVTPAQLMVKGVITAFDEGTSGKGGGVGYKGFRVGAKGGKSMISGTVYVVDTTTATVVASHNFEATVKSKGLKFGMNKHGFSGDIGGFKKTPAGKVMNEAIDDIIPFLDSQLESIKWSATVVMSKADRIIINRGTREGVSTGMVLRFGEVEEIRDPDTGELLDSDFTEQGAVEVTKVKEKVAYCRKLRGKAPKKGQSVFQ